MIPEVHRTIQLEPSVSETEAIIFENVTITRRVPPDSEHLKNNNLKQGQKNVKLSKTEKRIQKDLKKHRQRQKKLEKNSKEVSQPVKADVIAFELEQINLRIKKVIVGLIFTIFISIRLCYNVVLNILGPLHWDLWADWKW